MKKIYNVRLVIITLFSAFALGFCSACSDDDGEGIKIYEYREQIGKKIKELTDLQAASQFGLRQGMYPETSRVILETAAAELKTFLQTIKEKGIAEEQIPSETAKLLQESDAKIAEFKATVRTEDLLVPAELHVNGKRGGYIDFGSHPEYSGFDGGFTVEMWFKFEEIGSFDYLLSTFVDTQSDNPRLRQGWAVNYYGEGGSRSLRMTYALGVLDLYEPWARFEEAQKWVHIAMVWNPAKEDDGSGNPVTFKMYLDGEPVKVEDWGRTDYNPNVQNVSMIGFNYTNFDGSIATDGKGTNGYMKHLHIWNSVKSQAEVQDIMNHPAEVTGQESDLVCGWSFTQMALDDQAIEDLTGRYTARLVGDYNWIEE